jgi:hypothetical protein
VFEKVFHARCRPSLRITSSCAPPTTCRWPAVVESQGFALSIRYEERSKRIPLLIRLPKDMARCLVLIGIQQPTTTDDQQQRVLVSVPGREGGLGLIIDCAFSGTFEGDGYSWPWYRSVQSSEVSCRLDTSYASVIRVTARVHILPHIENMANPGRGGAWHLLFSARWFRYGSKGVAMMGTSLACACPRLSLRSHARCVWLVWSAVCLSL